jgi:hypothetical protein
VGDVVWGWLRVVVIVAVRKLEIVRGL